MEAGGFRGRTNKLVDGCYGWWVGGGFAVLEELLRREKAGGHIPSVDVEEKDDEWEDVPGEFSLSIDDWDKALQKD